MPTVKQVDIGTKLRPPIFIILFILFLLNIIPQFNFSILNYCQFISNYLYSIPKIGQSSYFSPTDMFRHVFL